MAVAMAFAVIMVVMALGVRVILQGSTDKRLNLLVGVPVHTGVQCDASAGQRLSSATANPTAQQDGYAVVFSEIQRERRARFRWRPEFDSSAGMNP